MKADLIVDLQFGSTGKGLLAAFLAASDMGYTAAVTANGPNAGHTSYAPIGDLRDDSGEPYREKVVRCILPNSPCHSKKIREVFIAPGASFYVDAFLEEHRDTLRYNPGLRVLIHPHASVVRREHADAEKTLNAIGSTQKGSMEAVVSKLRRPTFGANVACNEEALRPFVVSAPEWEEALNRHALVLVEGSQGFSLGLNSGFYPYTTSRECSAHQLASDCLIPRRSIRTVYGSARTFPIRVANRFDAAGNQVGWSGPWYPDQTETSFAEIGVPVEYTTVTKLPRRVFTFSLRQVAEAVRRSGVDQVFLNFVNYLDPDFRWQSSKGRALAQKVEQACHEIGSPTKVTLLGFGALDTQIVEIVTGVRYERF